MEHSPEKSGLFYEDFMRTEEKFVVVNVDFEMTDFCMVGDIIYKTKDEKYTSHRMNTRFSNDLGISWDIINSFTELVPFEIYNSPLFKIMYEID